MDERRSRHEDPQTAGPEYSTLFVIWPEAERPLEEEVRLALSAAYEDVTQLDELEVTDEVLWGSTWSIPGPADRERSEYVVWAQTRASFLDPFLADGLHDPSDHDLALQSKWLIGIETQLDPGRPQASFQDQLRLVSQVAVPGLIAVYDDNALRVRSGREVEDLCSCPVPPRARTLYDVHAVNGVDGGVWLHTHGLGRAGLPDLDLVGVPSGAAEDAHELLHAVVDGLLGGIEPDPDGRLEIGEQVTVRLVPLDTALPFYAVDAAGGRDDRRGEVADHAAQRLVVLDPVRDVTPLRQISQVHEDPTLYTTADELERLRVLSTGRWGTFGQLFIMHRDHDWRFHVRMACDRSTASPDREHLWFEVLGLKPGQVHGRLMNEPVNVAGLACGQEVWQPLDRLTDWLIQTPNGAYDPETAPALLPD